MLIKFTSQMDYDDFLEGLDDLDVVSVSTNQDELEVKVNKDDILGALESVAESGLETELYHLYGAKIEDWHDD
jgi:hypothetical protein